jgi:hypothetical protein
MHGIYNYIPNTNMFLGYIYIYIYIYSVSAVLYLQFVLHVIYYYYHHYYPCYHLYAGYLQLHTMLQLFCIYNLCYM